MNFLNSLVCSAVIVHKKHNFFNIFHRLFNCGVDPIRRAFSIVPSIGLPEHINVRMICCFFIKTYTPTSKYYGNIWLRVISTSAYLQGTLPFIQTWWWLTNPCLLITISGFNNLVCLFFESITKNIDDWWRLNFWDGRKRPHLGSPESELPPVQIKHSLMTLCHFIRTSR